MLSTLNQNILSSTSEECRRLGLSCSNVTWEDLSRDKNSCWGMNICDMTLSVVPSGMISQAFNRDGTRCPVIRKPNFADVTADLPIDKFTVAVGNECGATELKTSSLSTFLQNINSYLPEGGRFKTSPLLARDTHILTSVQYCVLPVADNTETEFNVALYNYNTFSDDDASVLTVVVSSQGTSMQTIKSRNTTLRFNKNGKMCNFSAQRVEEYRKSQGETDPAKINARSLSTTERERNVLFVFQIPLKRQKPAVTRGGYGGYESASIGGAAAACAAGAFGSNLVANSTSFRQGVRERQSSRGMSAGILSHGKELGTFDNVTQTMERDERFPIRCTIQYYMLTDSPTVSSEMLLEMKNKIDSVYANGDNIGSLVVDETTKRNGTMLAPRPTESTQPASSYPLKMPNGCVTQMPSEQNVHSSLAMNWL